MAYIAGDSTAMFVPDAQHTSLIVVVPIGTLNARVPAPGQPHRPQGPAGSGRGEPPVPPPGERMKVPLFPALSRRVPFSAGSTIVASMGTGVPPGSTTFRPKPIDPSGFWNATPTALAAWAAPHRSSVPSSV